MGRASAVWLLEAHGIAWRLRADWLEVLDYGTRDGEPCEVWVACPRSRAALLVWLGY
jgi:hypothetical protein